MRVAERVAFFVAHRFQELVDPDGGVDGETLFVERFELYGTGAWLDDGPKASDAHEAKAGDGRLVRM